MKKLISAILALSLLFSVAFASAPTFTSFLELYASRVQSYNDTRKDGKLQPFIYPMPSLMPALVGFPFSAGNLFFDMDTGMLKRVQINFYVIGSDEDVSKSVERMTLAAIAYSAVEYDQQYEQMVDMMYEFGAATYPTVFESSMDKIDAIVKKLDKKNVALLIRGKNVDLFDTQVAKWQLLPVNRYGQNGIIDVYLVGDII